MTKFLRFVFAIAVATTSHFTAASQSLSVNTTGAVADPSAILDVTSTAKGVLIPRMDKTQKNAIATPATGLLIYQTLPDSLGFHYYDGTKWVWLSGTSDSTAWKITGNSNITSSNFLGTTNDSALRFRIRNFPSGMIDSASKNTGIGYKNYSVITTGTGNNAIGYMAAKNLSVGSNNNAMGRDALTRTGGSIGNVAIGDSALSQALSQTNNVAIGVNAIKNGNVNVDNIAIGTGSMENSINNGGNIGIGYHTLRNYNGGSFYVYNTAIGYGSQEDTTSAAPSSYYNTSVGAFSLQYQKQGGYNVAIGMSALRNNDSSFNNTAVGGDVMYNHRGTNGSNTALGAFALRGDSVGYWNTAIGSEAMDRAGFDGTDRGTGFSNVAVGFRALRGAREAFENTAVGVGALELDSSGNYNTAVGRYSSFLNKRGDFNVSMGYRASTNADTATNTVAIGSYALSNNKQDNNVAVGYAAGYNAGSIAGGDPKEITFVGYEAGRGSWYSNKNTAVGFRALSNTTASFGVYDAAGGRNTVVGDSAMAFSIGSSNTVIGTEALANASDPAAPQFIYNNVAIGDSAMGAAQSNGGALYDNVAVGFRSLTRAKNQGNIAIGAYAGNELANTVWNTAVGYHALETDTTGSENTVMGTSAFRFNPNGVRNVSVGINTGLWSTSGYNTYIGSYAGQGISGKSTGGSNTAVGDYSLLNIRSGAQNVAMGENALASDSSGGRNVALGAGVLENNLRGSDKIAIGFWAGRNDTATDNTVYIGRDAGYYNQEDNTVAIGHYALRNNSLGAVAGAAIENVAVGAYSMTANTSGGFNTALGNSTLYTNTTGSFNTALGDNNLYNSNSTGNTAVGSNVLGILTSGSYNTATGTNAMFNDTSGSHNVAYGYWSLFENRNGNYNTAYGWRSAKENRTGDNNIAVGRAALYNNQASDYNVAVGDSALARTAVASGTAGNIGIGRNAGNTNTTGTFNTLIGYQADVSATSFINATALGYRAYAGASNSLVLGSINGVNSATSNTNVGIGTTTPDSTFSVADNFLVGSSGTVQYANSVPVMNYMFKSGFANADRMVIAHSTVAPDWGLEYQDASDQFNFLAGGANRMAIDLSNGRVGINNAAPGDMLHVGTTTGARVRIGSLESIEDFGANILAVNASFYPTTDNARSLGITANRWTAVYAVNGTIQTSDARDKENITNLNYGLTEIMKLRPVMFNWKNNPQWGKKIGFIAQEVQPILGEVVQMGDLKMNPVKGDEQPAADAKMSDKLGIYYSDIIPVTVKAIQEQQQTIQNQQKTIDELKKKNEQLEKDMHLIKVKLGINN